MPDREKIRQTLEMFADNQVSDWNQGGRDDVGSGVCMGMCLEWIRRILHRKGGFGTPAARRSAVYNEDEESWSPWENTREKRFQKQVKTHGILRAAQSNALYHSLETDAEAFAGHFEKSHSRPPNEAEIADHAIQLFRLELPRLYRESYDNFQTSWKLSTMKQRRFREPTVRKSNYDRIAVDTASMPVLDHGSTPLDGQTLYTGYVRPALLGMPAAACAVLSAGKAAQSGHDMAFHVPTAGGTVYYFDPNLGEFAFPWAGEELEQFWTAIWDAAYLERNYVWAFFAVFSFS